MNSGTGGPSEWRAGWRPLTAATIGVAYGIALFYMAGGLFVVPMQNEFGWSRKLVVIIPIIGLVSAGIIPFVGALADRIGARTVGLTGLVLLVPGYVMLAFMPPNTTIYLATAVYFGLIAGGATVIVFGKTVAGWFKKNAGAALGIVNSGTSLGMLVMVPIIAYVIQQYGWRAGFLTMAASVVIVGIPAVFFWLREAPTPVAPVQGAEPEGEQVTLGHAAKDIRFWMVLSAIGIGSLPIGAFLTQVNPVLQSKGFSPEVAASFLTVYAVALGLGRLLSGFMLDRMRPQIVAALFYGVPAPVALYLSHLGTSENPVIPVFVSVVILALTQGGFANFVVYFMLRLFGRRSFSMFAGICGCVASLSLSIGGFVFAAAFDEFGNYDTAMMLGAVAYAVAAIIFLLINMTPRPQREVPAASVSRAA